MNLPDRIAELDAQIQDLAQKQREALQFASQCAQQVAYLTGQHDMLVEMQREAAKAAQEA